MLLKSVPQGCAVRGEEFFTDYLHSIILENPVAWYTAEGGVTALDIMLGDLEKIY